MEYIANLICLLASCLPTVTAQSGQPRESALHSEQMALFEHKTRRIVGHFSTSGRTLVASVVDLAYRYELPMAVEYAEHDATARPLNLEFDHESVRAILEDIVRQAPQYRVSFSNNIVDIFAPKAREDTSNLFNTVIKDFSVTEMETRRAEFQLFCNLSTVTGSSACSGSLATGQWEHVSGELLFRP